MKKSQPHYIQMVTAILIVVALVGCHTRARIAPADRAGANWTVQLTGVLTAEETGAGQGLEVRDGLVYLYGDRGIGVIREYRPQPDAVTGSWRLHYTGGELQLTRHGEDLVSHPTGLT